MNMRWFEQCEAPARRIGIADAALVCVVGLCLGAGLTSGLAQPDEITDDFERGALGDNWKVIRGDWTVVDGRLVQSSDGGGSIQWVDTLPGRPCVVEVTMRQKYVYDIPWKEPMAGLELTGESAPDRALRIYRRCGGNIERPPEPDENDRQILGAVRGRQVRFAVEVTGHGVTIYANDEYVATTRPAERAPVKVSLFASAKCKFDDFSIQPGSYRPEVDWDFEPIADYISSDSYAMLQRLRRLSKELRSRNVFCSRRPGSRFTGSTDPEENFRRQLRQIQQRIDEAAAVGETALTAYGRELEATLQRCRLVTWPFNPYLLVSKKALPAGLADMEKLKVVCAQNEIEPAAFYVSNLRDVPCTLEVDITGATEALRARYVGTRGKYVDIIRPLGYVAETGQVRDAPTLTVPAGQSRQVWIDVDTHHLEPGNHRFTVQLTPREKGWPEKTVELHVRVLLVTLPDEVPFDTFAFNYARSRPECIADLKQHRVNWFSMGEPKWELVDGRVEMDFNHIDQEIPVSRGKGPHMSIYGFVESIAKTLRKKYDIPWQDPRTEGIIVDYLRQWVTHLEELGLQKEDYVLQVWDEPRTEDVFAKLREIMPVLRRQAPGVRFMTDPLTQDADFLRDMGPYIDLWVPHHGTVFVNVPDPNTVAERLPNNKNAVTLGIYKDHQQDGARLWSYFQYATEQGSYKNCPVTIFRHFVWKIVWRMKADGVSFFAHWYASGHLKYPCKGWEAWREGVEDVQWAMMLRDAVRSGKLATPRAKEALKQVDHLGAGRDWWINQPLQRCEDMDRARQIAMRTLAGLPVTKQRRSD